MLFQPSNSSSLSSSHHNEVATSGYDKIGIALFSMLIASLPFFSIRNAAFAVSPPLVMLLLITGTVFLRSMLTLQLRLTFSKFDIAVVLYVAVVLINMSLVVNAEDARFGLIKTLIYVTSYFCLKQLLQNHSMANIALAVKSGVAIGTCLFLLTAVACLFITGHISAITKFDYYSLTKNTFISIGSVFGTGKIDDFEGKDIMRNAVAEAFTFYFLCTLIFKFKSRIANVFILLLNVVLVLCTFSRRAFHSIAVVIFGGSFFDQAGLKRGISMALLVGSVVVGSLLIQEEPAESRLADFSGSGRADQYLEALDNFSHSPWLGTGFGSKLERGSYVHNFVFGSAAMLGVAGLFIALYLYVFAIAQFIIGLAKPRIYNTSTLLIIPILGMTVGSTFEGLFTITSWIAFILFSHCSDLRENVEAKFAEVPSDATNY